MAFSAAIFERVCTAAAAAVCCGLAKAVGIDGADFFAEAILSGVGLFAIFRSERATDLDAILRKSIRESAASTADFGHHEGWGNQSGIEAAVSALDEALPEVFRDSSFCREIAAAGINRTRFVEIMLQRTAKLVPDFAKDNAENQYAVSFFQSAFGNAFDRIRSDPKINSHAFEEILSSLSRLEISLSEVHSDVKNVRSGVEDIKALETLQMAELNALNLRVKDISILLQALRDTQAGASKEGLSTEELQEVLASFGFREHTTRKDAIDMLKRWADERLSSRLKYDALLGQLTPYVDTQAANHDLSIPEHVLAAFRTVESINAEYAERSQHPQALPKSSQDFFAIIGERYRREHNGRSIEVREIALSDPNLVPALHFRNNESGAVIIFAAGIDRALLRLLLTRSGVDLLVSHQRKTTSLRDEIDATFRLMAIERESGPTFETVEAMLPDLLALELLFPYLDRAKFDFGTTRGDRARAAAVAADVYGIPLSTAEFALSPVVGSYVRRCRELIGAPAS